MTFHGNGAPTRKTTDWIAYLALVAVVVGFVNFFSFFIESQILGGDALNGAVRDGHYYLASHGSLSEVDQATWEWSRFHATSVFVTHPLALLGMAYLLFRYAFPYLMGVPRESEDPARVQTVAASGPMITSGGLNGQVGQVAFRRLPFDVMVYPGGLLVKPALMPMFAILAEEIESVRPRRGILSSGIEVAHKGVGSRSPLVLGASAGSPIAQAIADLSAGRGSVKAGPFGVPVRGGWGRRLGSILSYGYLPNESAPRGVVPVLNLLGVVVAIVLIVSGFIWAIPQLGAFGVIWTLMVIAILAVNLARLYRGSRGG